MAYANATERGQFIAGLRSLADFLEGSPDVPCPYRVDALVFPPASSDIEMRSEIDGIAKLIGAEVDDQTADYGHYTASRDFGPARYRAVVIPARSREYHDARQSYAENVLPATDEEA
jgi:hypothetical protein